LRFELGGQLAAPHRLHLDDQIDLVFDRWLIQKQTNAAAIRHYGQAAE